MERSDAEPSVAERVIARERVLLDREIELYRLRHLAGPARSARPRPAPPAGDQRSESGDGSELSARR